MGKSARVLGQEFGLSARRMNELLKEHGYLDGSPGAYGLTEKGQQYGEEQYHSRGTGGYAQYNPYWETRTWNDGTAAALRADMEAAPAGRPAAEDSPAVEEDVFGDQPFTDHGGDGGEAPQRRWTGLMIGGVVVGALLVAPHVKPFWDNKVKPAAKKLRNGLKKQEPAEPAES